MNVKTWEMFEISQRLKNLPPYPFAELEHIKATLIKEGKDIISFAVGDPDIQTPGFIVEAMKRAFEVNDFHRYPIGYGLEELRVAIAKWYKKRFDVDLNPDDEILILIGSKEGLAHLPLALINLGDYAIVPDPCYPVYWRSVVFAGGLPYFTPLRKENKYLIDFDSIPKEIAVRAKILFLNYPNNPTGSICDINFFKTAIKFAKKYKLSIIHDAAYSEIYFNEKPVSFLSVKDAKKVGIEFHSFSKTFNMAGWRIGWACGNKELIKALWSVKENYDSGVFYPIQLAGVAALNYWDKYIDELREVYRKRRDLLINAMNEIGWNVEPPKATFYVWAEIPNKMNSFDFTKKMLNEINVLLTPGSAFGEHGEGFVRFSLTLSEEKIEEAVKRFKTFKW